MIGFFFRDNNSRSVAASEKLKKLFDENGLKHKDIPYNEEQAADAKDVHLLVVFGGDGSVLRSVRIALSGIPIVAINTGNVGFLTSYEEGELQSLVDDIINDRLKFSKRRLMEVCFGEKVYYALNDVVVVKNYQVDSASECIKLHFKIDGEFVDSYVADGLVVATPTGSTAYALSAGGPIMTPKVDAMVATPICAHSLHARPIVFSSHAKCAIIVDKGEKECSLYVDGEKVAVLPSGSEIFASQSEFSIDICDYAHNFFDKLSKKLNIWSTTRWSEDN